MTDLRAGDETGIRADERRKCAEEIRAAARKIDNFGLLVLVRAATLDAADVIDAPAPEPAPAVRRYDTGPDRWAELRATIKQDRDGYYEQACDHSEMAGHDAQEERAFGRVDECDDILAAMDRAEKEGQ